jgi:hypothetical protein
MKSLIGKLRRPDVIFRANGHFDITARAARILDLHAGDVIDIISDDCEYFLCVAIRAKDAAFGRYETRCYPSKHGARHFRGSSAALCRAMLDACHTTAPYVALPCGEPCHDSANGRTLLPIITKLPNTPQK